MDTILSTMNLFRRHVWLSGFLHLILLTICQWVPVSETAAVALSQYYMDLDSDCISAGLLNIPRGQVTRLMAPSKDPGTAKQKMSCRLQFSPQTEGDTLRLSLEHGTFFQNCDVSLELQMTNQEKIILGCKSNIGNVQMEAMNGQASVWLSRKQLTDVTYWFQISITSFKSEAQQPSGGSSTANVGLIVGITAGAIALLVVGVIICVCCYRKRRSGGIKAEYKEDIVKNSHSITIGHGYENNMAKINYDDSFQKSPGSGKRLLDKNYSANDENNGKPRSALERFGQPQGKSNVESKDISVSGGNEYSGSESSSTKTCTESREVEKTHGTKNKKVINDVPAQIPSVPKSGYQEFKFPKNYPDTEVTSFSNSSTSGEFEKDTNMIPSRSHTHSLGPSRQKKYNARITSSSSEETKFEEEKSMKAYKKSESRNDVGNEIARLESKLPELKKKDTQNDKGNEENRNQENEHNKLRRKHAEQENERRKMSENREDKRKRGSSTRTLEDDDERLNKRDGEYEGRFKKSASGRKPKSKNQRMGRSRSAGNALEDLDSSYHRHRSKSPSSVRSLVLAEDENDDDSNIIPFHRSGSKTSLYASRSSLYGRKRKNSLGETVSMSSYMHDDVDSRMGDFDKTWMTHKEKERLVKSTGDLYMGSAVVFRECATQTGIKKEVYIYGRRTLFKEPSRKCYDHGTQTGFNNERRSSVGSNKSGKSSRSYKQSKSKSKSVESLRKEKHSRSRLFSEDDSFSERSHRKRPSKARGKDLSDSDNGQSPSMSDTDDDISKKGKQSQNKPRKAHSTVNQRRSEQKFKPNPKPRKSQDTVSNDTSVSDDEKSVTNSSIATSQPTVQQMNNIPHFYPGGYHFAYPQPSFTFAPAAPGGPPTMIPLTAVTQSTIRPMTQSTATKNPPDTNMSKWDQLVNLTEGLKKRRHQMGESIETESVLSSMWSQPAVHGVHPQASYSSLPYTADQRIPNLSTSYGSVIPESDDMAA